MIKQLLFLVVGLIAGFNCSSFFKGDHKPKQVQTAATESPDAIKSRSIAVETYYQGKMDSLAQTNTTLGRQVNNTKSELQKVKQDNKVLKELVDTLIVHADHQTDTAGKLADCDSLQSTVIDLMVSSGQKDSLYESLTNSLQAEIANKDSSAGFQQQAYNALKLSFDHSLAQQDLLSAQSLQWEHQLKKMKAKNKLLSAGLFIVSGIATYSLIKH